MQPGPRAPHRFAVARDIPPTASSWVGTRGWDSASAPGRNRAAAISEKVSWAFVGEIAPGGQNVARKGPRASTIEQWKSAESACESVDGLNDAR